MDVGDTHSNDEAAHGSVMSGDEMRTCRLRPEFTALYPGVPPGTWRPVHEILDAVAASRLLSGSGSAELIAGRALDDRHFEFRGEVARPPGQRSRVTDA